MSRACRYWNLRSKTRRAQFPPRSNRPLKSFLSISSRYRANRWLSSGLKSRVCFLSTLAFCRRGTSPSEVQASAFLLTKRSLVAHCLVIVLLVSRTSNSSKKTLKYSHLHHLHQLHPNLPTNQATMKLSTILPLISLLSTSTMAKCTPKDDDKTTSYPQSRPAVVLCAKYSV